MHNVRGKKLWGMSWVLVALLALTFVGFGHPRVDTLVLQSLAEPGVALAIQPYAEPGEITLAVEVEPGFTWPTDWKQYVGRSLPNLWEVTIPTTLLDSLADVPGVTWVRFPFSPQTQPVPATAASEGVPLTGATAWHTQGHRGQGVKVAVIDIGFGGLAALRAEGKLTNLVEAKSYYGCGRDFLGDSPHGTACAEALWDMAPEAEFYLLMVGCEFSLAEAVQDCIRWGVQVISMSLGFLGTNFGDGTGRICDIARMATRAGILWVNAAGNHGDGTHWYGTWTDTNRNSYHEFAPGVEWNEFVVGAGTTTILWLVWDRFPKTQQDYDIHLKDMVTGQIVWRDGNRQRNTPPAEAIGIQAKRDMRLAWAIYAYRASETNVRFRMLTTTNIRMAHFRSDGSITTPAEVAEVVAVGAIAIHNWTGGPQRPYSSQGPTLSGVPKPDIMGPDGVSGFAWPGAFAGTSAAAPHVAGAAAILWSASPRSTTDQVRDWLFRYAVDMGAPGFDPVYGHGRLYMGGAPRHSHTYPAASGWYMVSSPVGTVTSTFGARVLRWCVLCDQYLSPESIEPFLGYWANLPARHTATAQGVIVDSRILVLRKAGWHQVSAPFTVPRASLLFKVEDEDRILWWDQAVEAGWIGNVLWGYTPATGYANYAAFAPWYGYWMLVKVDNLRVTIARPMNGLPPPVPPLNPTSVEMLPPPPPPDAPPASLAFGNTPNPVTDVNTTRFYVSGVEAQEIHVIVLDLSGRMVWEGRSVGGELYWHTEDVVGRYVANGVYLYSIRVQVSGSWVTSGLQRLAIYR